MLNHAQPFLTMVLFPKEAILPIYSECSEIEVKLKSSPRLLLAWWEKQSFSPFQPETCFFFIYFCPAAHHWKNILYVLSRWVFAFPHVGRCIQTLGKKDPLLINPSHAPHQPLFLLSLHGDLSFHRWDRIQSRDRHKLGK